MPSKLSYLNDFASETPLHGFTYTSAESKVAKGVWLILVTVAVGLAVSDMYNLVTYYISEPLTVEAKTEPNGNLTIPTPTLCMQIHLAPNRIWNMSNWRWELTLFLQQTDNGQKSEFNTEWIANGSYHNYPAVFKPNSSLLALTYLMLGYITDGELKVVGQKQDYNTLLAVNLVPTYPSVLSQLQPLYNLYLSNNISLKFLKSLVGAALCQQRFGSFIKFQYITDTPTIYLPLCKPSMISHVSFALICSKLLESPNMVFDDPFKRAFAITDAQGYSFAQFDYINNNNTEFETINQFFDTVNRSPTYIMRYNNWYLDMRGRDVPPTDSTSDVAVWSPKEYVGFSVSVSHEFNFYQSDVHKCSSLESNYNCQWRKRAEFMRKSCGCWPTASVNVAQTVIDTSCSENLSRKLNHITKLSYKDYGCLSAVVLQNTTDVCLPDCTVLAYSIAKRAPTKQITVDDRMRYRLRQQVLGYAEFNFCTSDKRQVFTEVLFKSWGGNFVSDFGGSIGTWLGGSLLAFIHVPLFVLEKFVKWKNRGNQQSGTNELKTNTTYKGERSYH